MLYTHKQQSVCAYSSRRVITWTKQQDHKDITRIGSLHDVSTGHRLALKHLKCLKTRTRYISKGRNISKTTGLHLSIHTHSHTLRCAFYFSWAKSGHMINTLNYASMEFFSTLFCLIQSVVIGWEMQHRNRALRTVLRISISACSSILTTSVNGGRTSGFGSQHLVMISARVGRQSWGIAGRTPLFTTAKAACTAVMLAKGSMPVMSSHSTMPKL